MEESECGAGEKKKGERGPFEKHAVGGRGYVLVVSIHI